MKPLLDSIIENASFDGCDNDTIQIGTTDDFWAIAEVSVSDPVESKPVNPEERYYDTLFNELFCEVKFFYGQYKKASQEGFSQSRLELVQQRLNLILDSIQEAYPVLKEQFSNKLNSTNPQDAETAAFVISYVVTEGDSRKDIKKQNKLLDTEAWKPKIR